MRFGLALFVLASLETVHGFAAPLQSRQFSLAAAAAQSSCLRATTLDGRKIDGELKPLNDFLLVKVASAEEQTEGGILLTGKAKIEKTEGKVMAVGPGRTHQDSGIVVEIPVEIGEGVVYGKFDGLEIDLSGEKHTLIRGNDVLVKFKGDTLGADNVEVIADNVLVKVDETEEETEGGILIAKTATSETKPSTGTVIKVGPGRVASNGELMAMDVAVGDMVKFRDFAGNEVIIEGEDYSVVRMADILAKF